ncbi:hypothetical protein FVEN_g6171 [Fusarium venenatum]|uniref:uncharacterized protein n=1 Tax=Fusarium venenatum TaxID=56646 RepID=UPI001E15D0E3|nr:hypothetical protein FVEN_g6171 [Fusarium venenatum]KAH7004933.1 hypothetical protein EDB82DRAFT_63020 [Fusarium venenatum]
MALEDTLRLLIHTALHNNVLGDGIETWRDLSTLRFPPGMAETSHRIQLNQDMLQVPVLRRIVQHRLTGDAIQIIDLFPWITRLGQHDGIGTKFTGYCLRRGAAYVLAMNVSDDMRCFLMGHNPGSNAYAKYYQSKTSTIDFPSMLRGSDQTSALPRGSILLNRSADALLSPGYSRNGPLEA